MAVLGDIGPLHGRNGAEAQGNYETLFYKICRTYAFWAVWILSTLGNFTPVMAAGNTVEAKKDRKK